MSTPPGNACADSWGPAPARPHARPDEVHVWLASLERPEAGVEALRGLLSADEQERADRFHFSRDRRHFVVARATLREILGRYLRRPPEALRFTYTPFGKPDLAEADGGDAAAARLRFNLTHAGEVALYAVTLGREVGVDVEHVRRDVDCDAIAGHFFSQREVGALFSLPPEERPRAFFNCWTRKEAYIKARGEGLSLPLDQFDVSLSPGEPAALLRASDPREVTRWTLRELDAGPDYVAAVAAEGRDWRLRCWRHD